MLIDQLLPMRGVRTLDGFTLPASYRKLVATELTTDFRRSAQVREVPTPALGRGKMLVKILYASVNASDVLKTDGYYGDTTVPFDLGLEAVGQIVAVGPGVPASFLGKYRCLSDTGERGGMFAEYKVIPAFGGMAVPVPSGEPKFAAVAVTGFSVAVCLNTACKPRRGDRMLITAAAGSGGTYAVQLAKQKGAHVIGTCGSAEKAALLRSLGCDRPIDYRQEDVGEVLAREYPEGVNLVLENVGGALFDTCVDHLAERGKLVSFGYISDYKKDGAPRTARPVYDRLLAKSATVQGFAVKHYLKTGFVHGVKLMRDLSKGRVRAVLDPTEFVGIESVVDAVEHHHSGKNLGKVVVRMHP